MNKSGIFLGFASSMILAVGLQAGFKENVEKLILDKTGQKMKLAETINLASSKNVKFIVLDSDGNKLPAFVSSDGNIILGATNIFFSVNDADGNKIANKLKELSNSKMPSKDALKNFFSSLKSSEYISLKGKGNAVEYIVADPNCPSCQNTMAKIDDYINKGEVRLVIVGFLGGDSALKSSMLLQELQNKNQNDKVKLLKSVFSRSYTLPSKYKNIDTSKIMEINEKVVNAGIRSVPFHFTEK